jgi:hypothetical protein
LRVRGPDPGGEGHRDTQIQRRRGRDADHGSGAVEAERVAEPARSSRSARSACRRCPRRRHPPPACPSAGRMPTRPPALATFGPLRSRSASTSRPAPRRTEGPVVDLNLVDQTSKYSPYG